MARMRIDVTLVRHMGHVRSFERWKQEKQQWECLQGARAMSLGLSMQITHVVRVRDAAETDERSEEVRDETWKDGCGVTKSCCAAAGGAGSC